MGRITFEQFTTPLKSRHNYIVSHQKLKLAKNITLVTDLDKFMSSFESDLWIAGGAEVYAQTIQYADELYLTIIDYDFHCDKFFPDYSTFKLKKEIGPKFQNGLKYTYQLLTRF